jgi:cellobiose-specific phosphotransferase system component IIB
MKKNELKDLVIGIFSNNQIEESYKVKDVLLQIKYTTLYSEITSSDYELKILIIKMDDYIQFYTNYLNPQQLIHIFFNLLYYFLDYIDYN